MRCFGKIAKNIKWSFNMIKLFFYGQKKLLIIEHVILYRIYIMLARIDEKRAT